MKPGEYFLIDEAIELNKGRNTIELQVSNAGDRPIQVGSHYHFAETNPALNFDRPKTVGYRLNIAAGTAVRFEPGARRLSSSWSSVVREISSAFAEKSWELWGAKA